MAEAEARLVYVCSETAAWSRVCVGLSEGMDALPVLLWSLFLVFSLLLNLF